MDEIGLDQGWTPVRVEATDRRARGPGGQVATVTDNVVAVRRTAGGSAPPEPWTERWPRTPPRTTALSDAPEGTTTRRGPLDAGHRHREHDPAAMFEPPAGEER